MSSKVMFMGKSVDSRLIAQPDYYNLYLEIKPLGEIEKKGNMIGHFNYYYGGGQGEVIKLDVNYVHNTKTHITMLETEYNDKNYTENVFMSWENKEYPFMDEYDKNFKVYKNRIVIKNTDGEYHKLMDSIKPNSLFQIIEGENMMAEMKACFYSTNDAISKVPETELSSDAIKWKQSYNERIAKHNSVDDETYSDEHISIGVSI